MTASETAPRKAQKCEAAASLERTFALRLSPSEFYNDLALPIMLARAGNASVFGAIRSGLWRTVGVSLQAA